MRVILSHSAVVAPYQDDYLAPQTFVYLSVLLVHQAPDIEQLTKHIQSWLLQISSD